MFEYPDARLRVQNNIIGILTTKEKDKLRNLAKKVIEIANDPKYDK